MKLTGHKTRSVFERYNIVSDGDLRAAVAKLAARHGTVLGQSVPIAVNDGDRTDHFAQESVEAPPGFEPGVEVLQTSALPLGDGAPYKDKWRVLRPALPNLARRNVGAGNGIRTRDFDLGKVALYH